MPKPPESNRSDKTGMQGTIELDQLELAPDVQALLNETSAPAKQDPATPEPAGDDSAAPVDIRASADTHGDTIRTVFIAAAIITAAVWVVVGVLYLADYLL